MNNNLKLLYLKNKQKQKPSPKRLYNLTITRLPNLTITRLPVDNKIKFKNPRLIKTIDLRRKFPPVYDQGTLGSCTANALCSLIGYLNPKLVGSRLFLYYNERKLENNISDDTGSYLHDGIACLIKYGICQESLWPYIINKFAIKPTEICYTNALNHQALQVSNIDNNLLTMKTSLMKGHPFVVGILIYESFVSSQVAKTGKVRLPNKLKENILGGHAVICIGYNDNTQMWIMRNSWGPNWGDKGYFYLPYNYLIDDELSSDL